MSSIHLLTLNEIEEWKALLLRLPASQKDIYYFPEYYSLYEHNGDGKANCFVFEKKGNIALYPFLKNSINELGYDLADKYFDIQGAYGYNGIVTSSFEPSFIAAFHSAFDQYCQDNNIVAEFSRFHPILNNHVLASPRMNTMFSRHTVKLDLTPSIEDIWQKSFSPKNRNVIKKAEKDGVTIEESRDFGLFRQMYDQTMKNVGADLFYFFPERYYSDFQQLFGEKIMLCFAEYNGTPIAGSLFIFSGNYAHYHLSGRNRDFYKIAANNAVLWYAIKKAKEKGCKWFHFGGGTTEDDADPLLHFKRNFSKEMGEFWFGKSIHNHEVYNQIVTQWKRCHPDSYERNKVKLLGYRDL